MPCAKVYCCFLDWLCGNLTTLHTVYTKYMNITQLIRVSLSYSCSRGEHLKSTVPGICIADPHQISTGFEAKRQLRRTVQAKQKNDQSQGRKHELFIDSGASFLCYVAYSIILIDRPIGNL